MAKFKNEIFRVLGIIFGIGILAIGVFGIFKRSEVYIVKNVPPKSMREILQEDLIKIAKNEPLSLENIPSLLRLAREHDASVQAKIESLLGSENPEEIASLLKAAGFFELPKFEEFITSTYSKSTDEVVKEAAIEGLANTFTDARKKFLLEAYLNKQNNDKLQLKIIEGLLRLRPDEKQKSQYTLDLVKYIKNTKSKNLNFALQIFLNQITDTDLASALVGNNSENHKKLVVNAKTKFEGKDPTNIFLQEILANNMYDADFRSFAFMALMQKEDPWLKDNYIEFFLNKKYAIESLMRRIIANITLVCPSSRWDILGRILADNKFVNYRPDILNVIEKLYEEAGIELLTNELKFPNISQPDKYQIQAALNNLKANIASNKKPCR